MCVSMASRFTKNRLQVWSIGPYEKEKEINRMTNTMRSNYSKVPLKFINMLYGEP